jgi:hypothetical protein
MRTIDLTLEETLYLRGLVEREKKALEAKKQGLEAGYITTDKIQEELYNVRHELTQLRYIESYLW